MNTAIEHCGLDLETQRQYRDNFARHFLSVTLYIQAEIMAALTLKHGHSNLRLNFEPYITLAGHDGARLSDIAETLGISRQAANQIANQIEAAGYLRRTADRRDGRAKLLTRTPRARALVEQGASEAARLQARFAALTAAGDVEKTTLTLAQLNKHLALLVAREGGDLSLAAVLPRLSDHISTRLQELTMARGHPGLKRSFGSVLMSIGPAGGRIQQIADAHDVSKQAISAIASELEQLRYIARLPDPGDARQVILVFTAAGRRLIEDSVASTAQLYSELEALVGKRAFRQAASTLAALYQSLNLGEEIFGHVGDDDIGSIARQLTRQLGDERARALARVILAADPDEPARVSL